jgi:Fe-S-cluster-containing dehydrogenase component
MKKGRKSIEEHRDMISGKKLMAPGSEIEHLPYLYGDEPADFEGSNSHSRRDFLKMLGFGLGYVGLLSGCEMPVRKAIPYLIQPEQITPGVPNYYASTFYDGHDYCSIIVKNREGRPIKVEGNPLSTVTRGGTQARAQASVLNLYDSARLQRPLKDGQPADFEEIDKEIIFRLSDISAKGGKLVILTPTIISPSTRNLLLEFIQKYPGTSWISYDTVSASAMLKANEINFGKRCIPGYSFDKAELIVGFNADFLGNWLSPVEFTKQYTGRRRLMQGETTMPRHYQFESWLSLTGTNADYRIPIKPSEEGIILLNLYNELASFAGTPTYPVPAPSMEVKALAENLLKNKGQSLVVSGTNDVSIQQTVNSINALLGNYGKTIDLNFPCNLKQGNDEEKVKLIEEMNNGQVSGLFLFQVNPAYDYPMAEAFISGLKKVGLTVAITERPDESAKLVTYVCPDNNYLESWDDAEPKKGCFSTCQPVIRKIFNTRQAQESLLRWMGREPDFMAYMQDYWKNKIFPLQNSISDFPTFWDQSVRDGIFEVKENQAPQPVFNSSSLKPGDIPQGNDPEVVLYEKISIGDGRHANNPWLQELPDPVSLATWDNYVCISPGHAEKNSLVNGDVVKVNGQVELPVLVQPGQPEGTVAIAIGYGRTSAGKSGDGVGKNAYPLAIYSDGSLHYSGRKVSIEIIRDAKYPLALTQVHHTMENRPLVREAALEEYVSKPNAGNEMHVDISKENQTLYRFPVFPAFNWGMAINLNACTGCSSCVISCQAENNVAVIGKEQVRKRRIMHWIRIDRYYSDLADNPEVVHQPVMCQHCDNAPCENVCPVAATPHSEEGYNQMAYNRCVGTRYCLNNCPYKVRRFNWFEYSDKERFDYVVSNDMGRLVLNPDVTIRSRGVIEKCSLCVQRIQEKKLLAKRENRTLKDGEIRMACQQACPGDAIVFGDMNDPESEVSKIYRNPRTYQLLEQIHTLPSVSYMTRIWNKDLKDKKINYKRVPLESKNI